MSHLCFPKPEPCKRRKSVRKMKFPLKMKKDFLQVWGESKGPVSHTGTRKIIATAVERDVV